MTTDQFNAKIQSKIDAIVKYDKPLEIATRSVLAMQARRIFVQGKAADDGSIGKYSKKDIYVNPKDSPKKFTPKGKSGNTKFENGEPHKTGYFEGYGEYKKAIGRKDSPVNMTLSGELLKNFSNAETTGAAKPIKVDQHYYEVRLRDINAKKAEGNEEYFVKKIFGLSANERKTFIKIITTELGKALR